MSVAECMGVREVEGVSPVFTETAPEPGGETQPEPVPDQTSRGRTVADQLTTVPWGAAKPRILQGPGAPHPPCPHRSPVAPQDLGPLPESPGPPRGPPKTLQLLKTELGSFFTEYLQNQLLTKGMVILRDKIYFYEGQKLLDTLAQTWDYFFCNILSTLQAIFYPVQGKEPTVRQLALLHFRNVITLSIKLEDALSRPNACVPPSIIQMLLILQAVHESQGVTDNYLKLESLIQKVVSPYLGTHGLYTDGRCVPQCSCVLEKRWQRHLTQLTDSSARNPVMRSKSYNVPMLTTVAEYEMEPASVGSAGKRRHSVCQMTSCQEEPAFSSTKSSPESNITPQISASHPSTHQDSTRSGCRGQIKDTSPVPPPSMFPSICSQCSSEIVQMSHESGFDFMQEVATLPRGTTSPETITDRLLESLDSKSEGIFIDFSCHSSNISRELECGLGLQSQ